jgi:SAM-dependent methyltransferase
MNIEQRNIPILEMSEQKREKIRQEGREQTFRRYVEKLDLKESDFAPDKEILDVGSGNASFADRVAERGFGCRVVSIDREKFFGQAEIEKYKIKPIPQGGNLKIGNVDFENPELKEKLGLKEEPQFDLILSFSGPPHSIITWDVDFAKIGSQKWQEDSSLLQRKIKNIIGSTFTHLKAGGRAVFWPIYKSEVVDWPLYRGRTLESNGRKDFRLWRKILEEELWQLTEKENGKYIYYFQDTKQEGEHTVQRLVIKRKF